ncbi:unnamed protein product [Prorocentrum cordatum]|uniref:PARP catalytic domain-containing protein n=1 Tax=Prorocentrum cordatum TaxID=2364126 RepID=A0ABN9QAT2_9DINO|nr:unnamed protein product [Polarella glacialis]
MTWVCIRKDDGSASMFVEGPDDASDQVEEWLTDVNTNLADRVAPLAAALSLMVSTFPPRAGGGGHSGGGDASVDDSEEDPELDAEEEEADDDLEAARLGVDFPSWCRDWGLPVVGLEALRARFHAPCRPEGEQPSAEAPLLAQAAAARAPLAARGVRLRCEPELGLVQLSAGPVAGLGLGEALAVQVGLDAELPVVLSLVLSDSALGSGAAGGAGGPVAVACFTQPPRQGSSFALGDLLPRYVEAFCRQRSPPPRQEAPAWLEGDGQAAGPNFFLDLWCGLSSFARRLPGYCPVCLAPHSEDSTAEWCRPCAKELCTFRFEELFSSVRGELVRSRAVVELHIALASAAAMATGDSFEPFPPCFLRHREVRARSGAFEDDGQTGSTQNKDMLSLRSALSRVPAVERLALQGSEEGVRALLRGAGTAEDGDTTYKLLQFVLGSCRLVLEKLESEEHRLPLPRDASAVMQFAVLHGPPGPEAVLRARKAAHGSGFAFHGSPLPSWYSIVRNGLRNLSGTEFQNNGAAYGPGVYLADQLDVSEFYCNGFSGHGYFPCSFGEKVQVVGVFEYVKDPSCWRQNRWQRGGITVVSDPSALMLRYILVRTRTDEPTPVDI